jgi:hypothetical protein
MRSNLSYQQASDKANRKAVEAFKKAQSEGARFIDCQDIARLVYEAEMKWYEGHANG